MAHCTVLCTSYVSGALHLVPQQLYTLSSGRYSTQRGMPFMVVEAHSTTPQRAERGDFENRTTFTLSKPLILDSGYFVGLHCLDTFFIVLTWLLINYF